MRGASFSVTRRLVRGWMLRGHVTVSDWTWDLGPDFVRYDDPTNLDSPFGRYFRPNIALDQTTGTALALVRR